MVARSRMAGRSASCESSEIDFVASRAVREMACAGEPARSAFVMAWGVPQVGKGDVGSITSSSQFQSVGQGFLANVAAVVETGVDLTELFPVKVVFCHEFFVGHVRGDIPHQVRDLEHSGHLGHYCEDSHIHRTNSCMMLSITHR